MRPELDGERWLARRNRRVPLPPPTSPMPWAMRPIVGLYIVFLGTAGFWCVRYIVAWLVN